MRQNASTSTRVAESQQRKRLPQDSKKEIVPAKVPKKSDTPTATTSSESMAIEPPPLIESNRAHAHTISTDSQDSLIVEVGVDTNIPQANLEKSKEPSTSATCNENASNEASDNIDRQETQKQISIEVNEHNAHPVTEEARESIVSPSEIESDKSELTPNASSENSSSSEATGAKRMDTRNSGSSLPSSEIEFVTSTLAPRSKPGSTQTSRKNSPSTSRASPVHAAAYSQEALRDLVCATLAPAAAANLIKSEKREKKEKEPAEPVAGPSGLQPPASP